jgi:predicted HicB family RNase H-like nuclease
VAGKTDKIVFSLRLDKGMYATAATRAKELGISTNSFIRMTLARALETDKAS